MEENTENYILQIADRCDRCGAQAYAKAWTHDDKLPGLLFCGHHFRKHESALRLECKDILDETHRLVQNRLVGSEN